MKQLNYFDNETPLLVCGNYKLKQKENNKFIHILWKKKLGLRLLKNQLQVKMYVLTFLKLNMKIFISYYIHIINLLVFLAYQIIMNKFLCVKLYIFIYIR